MSIQKLLTVSALLRRDERDKHVALIRMVVAGSIEETVINLADPKLDYIAALREGRALDNGKLTRYD